MIKVPLFKPLRVQRHDESRLPHSGAGGDDRDGKTYVYHRGEIELAVNVALATRRPLLLSGPSGCGKSSLALNVALTLGWRYYEFVVNARSEARDLLWHFDSLRRLNDAQGSGIKDDELYLEPGALWWALDPQGAKRRGANSRPTSEHEAKDPNPIDSEKSLDSPAVVLIDEIDKADPDFPNNLLVPLGSMQFSVAPTRITVVGSQAPLIFITTNGERELPRAFVRRCVALELPSPKEEQLIEIAQAVLPKKEHDLQLFKSIADHVLRISKEEIGRGGANAPSTAEYLDTLRACVALGIDTEHEDFENLSQITLQKESVTGGRDL